jgi:tetratricopeptide (TPR) repeat protein
MGTRHRQSRPALITPLVGLLILYAGAVWAATEPYDPQAVFDGANASYIKEDYAKAADLYQNLVDNGNAGGNVYYNLGNTYFKLGDVGRARVNYERALRRMPRDPNLRANLALLDSVAVDRLEPETAPGFWRGLLFWHFSTSMFETTLIFAALYLACWGMAVARIYLKHRIVSRALYLVVFLTIILGSSCSYKMYASLRIKDGVVLNDGTDVTSGGGTDYTTLFQLNSGAKFRVVELADGWYQISLPSEQKRGWIQAADCEII